VRTCVIGIWALMAVSLAAQPRQRNGRAGAPRLQIRLYDTAGMAAPDLALARETVDAIYARAGVEVDWVDCSAPVPTGECAKVPGLSTVLVRVVPQKSPIADALGDSLIDYVAHRGTLATIFAGQVRAMAARARVGAGLLLGRAMAHEIGHILLGSTEHSAAGLMRAHWYDDDLLRNDPADWTFAAPDGGRMHLAAAARVDDGTSAGLDSAAQNDLLLHSVR
jgi:hypothetical protein